MLYSNKKIFKELSFYILFIYFWLCFVFVALRVFLLLRQLRATLPCCAQLPAAAASLVGEQGSGARRLQ